MSTKMITVSVYRFDPAKDEKSEYQAYDVPWGEGISAMDALDPHVNENHY